MPAALRPAPAHTRRRRFGFTLIELIVVIVVLGLLAALAVPGFRAATARTKDAALTTELQALGRGVAALAVIEQGIGVGTLTSFLTAEHNAADGQLLYDAPRGWSVVDNAPAGEPEDQVLYTASRGGYLAAAATVPHRSNRIVYLLVSTSGGTVQLVDGGEHALSGTDALCFFGIGDGCVGGHPDANLSGIGGGFDGTSPAPVPVGPGGPGDGGGDEDESGPTEPEVPAPPTVSYDGAFSLLPQHLNTARGHHTSVAGADGRVYVVGGWTGSIRLASVEVFDPSNPAAGWTVLPQQLNTARGHHTSVVGADGRIYAVGGWTGSARLATVEVFDPSNPAAGWTVLPQQLNTARSHHTSAVDADGRIYAISGMNNSGVRIATVEVFDPSNPAAGWTVLSQQLNTARDFHSASVGADGRIYAIGGFTGSIRLASVEVFDPSNPAAGWSLLPQQLNTARNSHVSVTGADGRIYVVGGWTGSIRLASVEVFDPSNPAAGWSVLPQQLNTARNSHAAAVGADGRIYITGGLDSSAARVASTEAFGNPD